MSNQLRTKRPGHEPHQLRVQPTSDSKLAALLNRRTARTSLTSLLLFVSIFLVLASARFGPRVLSVFQSGGGVGAISKVRTGIGAQIGLGLGIGGGAGAKSDSRPLMTGAMAPEKYRKPPQAPPLFVGTPASVVEDTKKLVGGFSAGRSIGI